MIPGIVASRSGAGGGVTDPNFANVLLLLHFDGSNGSTTFTDSSPSPKTITANGNAAITTAQSVFGGASGNFDGTGDYLTTSAAASVWNIIGGDFTIELWFRCTLSGTRNKTLLSTRGTSGPNAAGWNIDISSANGIVMNYWDSSGASYGVTVPDSSLAINSWHHVAFCRSGNTVRAFLDGVQQGSSTWSATPTVGQGLYVGRTTTINTARDFPGQIDDLRITTAARYTSDFTPPTSPFPDS